MDFSPPSSRIHAGTPSLQLRTRAACNIYKSKNLPTYASALGSNRQKPKAHDPFDPQHTAMEKVFESQGLTCRKETWRKWFAGVSSPGPAKLRDLDRTYDPAYPYLSKLITGARLTRTRNTPPDPLHIHFSALDAAAYVGESGDAEWVAERETRSQQVLLDLHRRWRPNFQGVIEMPFQSLHGSGTPSTSTCRLRAADYNYFSADSIGLFLLSLAQDDAFFNDERRTIWAIDLASAALATYGLLYCESHLFHWGKIQEHGTLWAGASSLFWERPIRFIYDFDFTRHDPGPVVIKNLRLARRHYRHWLAGMGLRPSHIVPLLHAATTARPTKIGAKTPGEFLYTA